MLEEENILEWFAYYHVILSDLKGSPLVMSWYIYVYYVVYECLPVPPILFPLLLSFLELSAGQIGSITGALTFTLAVVNQRRSPFNMLVTKPTQTISTWLKELLEISLEFPPLCRQRQLYVANAFEEMAAQFDYTQLHQLLPASPSSCRCYICISSATKVPTMLSFFFLLHFQRTMALVYCFVCQHFVNFLVVFITNFPSIQNCNFTVFT